MSLRWTELDEGRRRERFGDFIERIRELLKKVGAPAVLLIAGAATIGILLAASLAFPEAGFRSADVARERVVNPARGSSAASGDVDVLGLFAEFGASASPIGSSAGVAAALSFVTNGSSPPLIFDLVDTAPGQPAEPGGPEGESPGQGPSSGPDATPPSEAPASAPGKSTGGPGKPGTAGSPQDTGKPGNAGSPQGSGKPGKPDAKGTGKPEAKGTGKPEATGTGKPGEPEENGTGKPGKPGAEGGGPSGTAAPPKDDGKPGNPGPPAGSGKPSDAEPAANGGQPGNAGSSPHSDNPGNAGGTDNGKPDHAGPPPGKGSTARELPA